MDEAAKQTGLIAVLLVVLILAVFGPVCSFHFTNYDDDTYVPNNPHVNTGLNAENVAWAFTTNHMANWHPVTWISHMLDIQMFGLRPGGHHAVNVLFHAANSVLLFLLFRRMTGAVWPSAFTAALFAVHPLHVESVAWVAERKDVLSAFLGFLTLIGYDAYVKQPTRMRYAWVLASFGLGLMAKPMLVTLPFLLLLLDYWPLKRFQSDRLLFREFGACLKRLTLEKAPLFALAVASSIITLVVQSRGGGVKPLAAFPLEDRLANAALSYVLYVEKMFWPSGLAVFYPHPVGRWPLWQPLGALAVLAGISILCVILIQRRPYLAVGWFWYLAMLVPVIGIVQVGNQAMADRYTYLPLIGLFAALAWGAAELGAALRVPRTVMAAAACAVVAAFAVASAIQVSYWRDNATLFERALSVTSNNNLAHYNLGLVALEQGKRDEAEAHFAEAVRIDPKDADALHNLGNLMAEQKEFGPAMEYYLRAIEANPKNASTFSNLGFALVEQQRYDEAIPRFEEAVRLDPALARAQLTLGSLLANKGRLDEAIGHFKRTLELDPANAQAIESLDKAEAMKRK